jgi:hypothetical protein
MEWQAEEHSSNSHRDYEEKQNAIDIVVGAGISITTECKRRQQAS